MIKKKLGKLKIEEHKIGENLKVVWAEFSTLSWTVLLNRSVISRYTYGHF